MFKNPSLITRIAIGKAIGLLIGLIAFFTLPHLVSEPPLMLRWAILLWYTTIGAIIGVFGVFTWHPILKLPMPWWFRAPLLGAWMNFVLTLFAHDTLHHMLMQFMRSDSAFTSPFWFVLEGAIVGLIIGYLATRFGGEGIETVKADIR